MMVMCNKFKQRGEWSHFDVYRLLLAPSSESWWFRWVTILHVCEYFVRFGQRTKVGNARNRRKTTAGI
jgi:hypothetical protein